MNQTWQASNTSKTTASSKVHKNQSFGVSNLIENRPGHNFANKMAAEDSNRFMTVNLKKRKPIFKNYTKTNASIIRKEIVDHKLEQISENER